MKTYKEIFNEKYQNLAKASITKELYPIFINPTKSEVRELALSSGMVRFIAYNGDLYVFDENLLHADAIFNLDLPLSSSPDFRIAFLGVAKANFNGVLQYYGSNHVISSELSIVAKYHSYMLKYFK